ncbi:hypothetical protein [Nocardioides marmoraquaticus]
MSHDPWRSARRAAALRHHPDRGGDAAALQAALAEVDRRFGRTALAPTPRGPHVVPTPRGRLAARARRLRRRLSRRRARHRIEI